MLDEAVLWTVLTRPRAEGVLEPPEHPPGYATVHVDMHESSDPRVYMLEWCYSIKITLVLFGSLVVLLFFRLYPGEGVLPDL